MKSVKILPAHTKGRLIVFEGISASGKSRNIERCYLYLVSLNLKVRIVQWNTNVYLRGLIAKLSKYRLLAASVYSFLQWIGFFLDYTFKIKPSLEENYIVLADRYIYTAFTRDFANGLRNKFVLKLNRFVQKPDLLFFHDLDPSECLKRIRNRGKPLFHTNRKLKKETHMKDRELVYLKMLRREYLLFFGEKQFMKNVRFVHLKGEMRNLPRLLHRYLEYESVNHRNRRSV